MERKEINHLSKWIEKIGPEAEKFRNRMIKHNIKVKMTGYLTE